MGFVTSLVGIWEFRLVLLILLVHVVLPIRNKKMADSPSRARALLGQFIVADALALLMAAPLGIRLDDAFGIVLGIGLLNAFACYCYWRAVAIGLAKTSAMTQADDLTCIGLGYLFLNEEKVLTPGFLAGVVLLICCAFVLSYHQPEKKDRNGTQAGVGTAERSSVPLWLWIAGYSIIWGILVFSMHYFSHQGMTLSNYALARYTGSVAGATVIFLCSNSKERGAPLSRSHLRSVALLGCVIMGGHILDYWVRSITHPAAVQSIMQVSEMVLPTMLGLWYFKEFQHLDRVAKAFMLVALVGAVLVMVNY